MADADVIGAINTAASLIEQLCISLAELEAHKDSIEDKVLAKEIGEHFRELESLMMKKYLEIDVREKAFKEEECHALSILAEKEEAVAAKEQEMVDRIQLLQDAAAASIKEARAKYLPTSLGIMADVKGNKVNGSLGDSNALVTDLKENSPQKTGANNGEVPSVVITRTGLTFLCEQMDSRGLLNFVTANQKNSDSICEELSLALESATEPGLLVLGALEGFYPSDGKTHDGDNERDDAALRGMRRSCVKLLEAMATLVARADHHLNYIVKQQAKAIADEWKPKLADAENIITTANGNSLEAEAFLQLLATFSIASEFDEEELCKLVLAIAQQRQAPELCRSLGLAQKVPGVVERLINSGNQISAVHFVHVFGLTEQFPTVPLLRTYLKDLRRNSQGRKGKSRNPDGPQMDGNARELKALKAVIKCVEEYKLEAEYPLDTIQRRATQLERSKHEGKRPADYVKHHQPNKKLRPNGAAPRFFRAPAAAVTAPPAAIGGERRGPPIYQERAYASGYPESYLPHAGLSGGYDHQGSSHVTAYSQLAYDPRSYYQQDESASATTYYSSADPSGYGGYPAVPPSYQPPYM